MISLSSSAEIDVTLLGKFYLVISDLSSVTRGPLSVGRLRGIAYLCMKMNVSKVHHSSFECSSRPCKDCTLRTGGRKTVFISVPPDYQEDIPFVTALLTIPFVSHPCRDIRPGYTFHRTALLDPHRPYDRSQLFDFLG
jgi:hypothetical protein